MNIEQERKDFEAWYEKEFPYEPIPIRAAEGYFHRYDNKLWNAYQAGRAARQSRDRESAELVELLREAAEIIAAVPTDYAPENLRKPIVDELEGFALMLDHARHIEGGIMTTKTDTEITKNEYLRRCSKRLIERSDIDEKTALEVAESIWENSIDRTAPEGDADEELSYWEIDDEY